MTEREKVLNILFDENDTICVCSQKHSTGKFMKKITRNKCNSAEGMFYVINPVKPNSDRRTKKDIDIFRNFLVEFDEMPLDEQIDYVKSIGMPYSAIVYSGNKSYHFLISLEEPLEGIEDYSHYAEYLHNVVKFSDRQTKESNKLGRYPEALRKETGKRQEVIEIRGRVTNSEFIDWLAKHDDCIPAKKDFSSSPSKKNRDKIIEVLDWYVKDYLKQDYDFDKKWTFVRCPVCADEGRDNHRDNMCITHERMTFNCFADSHHNSSQFWKMLELKNENKVGEAIEAWDEHNRNKIKLGSNGVLKDEIKGYAREKNEKLSDNIDLEIDNETKEIWDLLNE